MRSKRFILAAGYFGKQPAHNAPAGYLINISSIDAHGAFPGWGVYGSTKFALEGISQGLAVELAPFGIQVTAISPGLFRTDFLGPYSRRVASQPLAAYDTTAVGAMRTDAHHLHGHEPGDPKKVRLRTAN